MRRFIALALVLVGVLALVGWRWYTTPVPPELPLEGRDPAVVEAVQAARAAVERSPRSGPAWGKLAMVALANGFTEPTLLCLVQAERFEPSSPRWWYLHAHVLLSGQPQEALPLLRRSLTHVSTADQAAVVRFRLALALIEDGQFADAAEQLGALEDVDREGVRVRFGRGLLAAAQDERRLARAHLEAVESSPFARKQALARLAALALADGEPALARRCQQRLVTLPPDLPWPDPFLQEMNGYAAGRQHRFLEAENLEATGRLPEAVAVLRQIAAETPDARSYLALGLGLAKLGAWGEAEAVLRAALRLDAHNLQAQHNLGNVLFMAAEQQLQPNGDRERARSLLQQAVAAQEQALAIHRDHAPAHLMRGRALQKLGQTEAALASLRAAVLARPEFVDTHLYLGEALAEAGQFDEALTRLNDAVRLARPEDARPRQALERWQRVAQSRAR